MTAWPNWRRIVSIVLGVILIVLGLAGFHVEVGAVIVGAIAVGLFSGDWIVELVAAAHGRRRNGNGNGSPPP
jgi:hypothetical protein